MTHKFWFIMHINLTNTVVVFDLDDTLYPEADYVTSGIRHVCAQIHSLYGKDIYTDVNSALEANPKVDWLAFACECAGLPNTAKDSLLWDYRLHEPDICLTAECKTALESVRSSASAVAVLTDGRSVTQRLKLKALGLTDWPMYISEEYGAPKPNPERFKAIQSDYPAEHYVYVADNVKKDFLGCNPLGWIGVGMRGDHRNIHSNVLVDLPALAQPTYWVNSWEELSVLLCIK